MNEVFNKSMNEVFNKYCIYLKYLLQVACAEKGEDFDSTFKSLSMPQAKTKQNVEQPKPAPQPAPQPKTEPKPQPEPEPKSQPEPKPQPKPEPQPTPKPVEPEKEPTRLEFDDGYYVGETKNGLMHGKGTRYWFENEKKWTGDWVNGEANGHMVIKFGDFVAYDGMMSHNMLNGEGTYHDLRDGSCYKGEYVNNLKDGKGTLFNDQGVKIYEGEWKKDKYYGNGRYYLGGICRYDGQWKEGKKHGEGKEYDAKGNETYSGQWENDHKTSK